MVSLQAGMRGGSRRFDSPNSGLFPITSGPRYSGATYLLLFPLLLAGCVAPRPYSWFKPGVEQSDTQKDLADCEHQARVDVRQSRIPGETATGADYDILVQRSQVIESCMKAKGYRGQ